MAATALGNRKRHIKHEPMLPVAQRTGPGRKSLYKPEYCDIAVTLGKQGKSVSQIALILNVDRASINRWAADNEEFALALSRAKTFEQAWWEKKAQTSLGRKHFQAQLWRHSVAGRFDDYREQRDAGASNAFDLGAFVGALAQALQAPGDKAKPTNVLDVVPDKPKG
jgi:hypothetical protein